MSFHPKMPYGATRSTSRRATLAERGPAFDVLHAENRARFDEIVLRYPPDRRRSAVLPRSTRAGAAGLHHGERDAPRRRAARHHAADVEDVVSYYTMFYTKPVGQVRAAGLPDAVVRAQRRRARHRGAARQLGIKAGETDPSGTFTLIEVECLGACDRAPVVMVNDAWHECLAPKRRRAARRSPRGRGGAQRLPPVIEQRESVEGEDARWPNLPLRRPVLTRVRSPPSRPSRSTST